MNNTDEFDRDIQYCIFCKASTPHIDKQCVPCKKEQEAKVKYTQMWSCTRCKETGAVEYVEGEDVMRVLNKIIEDHRRRTVLCDGGAHTIKVYSPIDEVN